MVNFVILIGEYKIFNIYIYIIYFFALKVQIILTLK